GRRARSMFPGRRRSRRPPRSSRRASASLLERPVDGHAKLLDAVRADHGAAVDEKRGIAVDAERLGLLDVTLDVRRETALVQTARERVGIEAELARVGEQITAPELGLLREETIVVRPVLARGAGAARRLVRRARQGMHRERTILEDQPNATFILLEELGQRPLDQLTVRSLVVGEFDDR